MHCMTEQLQAAIRHVHASSPSRCVSSLRRSSYLSWTRQQASSIHIKMKLTIGLSAALAGFAAASHQAATDLAKVYILRGSHHIEPTTSLTPSEARLILHQRLAPEGEGPSFRDFTDSDDEERIISLMNKYGKTPAPLFSDDMTATPRQLVINIDGMPTFEYESFFGWLFNTKPDFTLDPSKENGEHPEIFQSIIANMPECPLSQIVAMDDNCFHGKAALATYSRSQVLKFLTLFCPCNLSNPWIRTVITLLPS